MPRTSHSADPSRAPPSLHACGCLGKANNNSPARLQQARAFIFADGMYRCEFCKALIAPSTPSCRVVEEYRPADYPRRERANRVVRKGKIEFVMIQEEVEPR